MATTTAPTTTKRQRHRWDEPPEKRLVKYVAGDVSALSYVIQRAVELGICSKGMARGIGGWLVLVADGVPDPISSSSTLADYRSVLDDLLEPRELEDGSWEAPIISIMEGYVGLDSGR